MGECKNLRKVTWNEISQKLRKLNKPLAEALEGVAKRDLQKLSEDHPFFLINYNYGDLIAKNGLFQPPCECRGPNNHCDSCDELAKILEEIYIPLCVVMNNSIEVFIEYSQDHRCSAPLNILSPGAIFGVFETLEKVYDIKDEAPPWSVSAGLRSVFLCCPYGNDALQKNINDASGVRIDWTIAQNDAWELIKKASGNVPELAYSCEILLIPPIYINGDHTLTETKSLLLETAWLQGSAMRESSAKRNRNEQQLGYGTINHHLRKTTHHIEEICAGRFPAFRPFLGDESSTLGPYFKFQEWLLEIMAGTKRIGCVAPVLMVPAFLSTESESYFYSVSRPSLPGPIPDKDEEIKFKETTYAQSIDSLIDDLERLKDFRVSAYTLESLSLGTPSAIKRALDNGDIKPEDMVNPTLLKYPLDLKLSRGIGFFSGCLRLSKYE